MSASPAAQPPLAQHHESSGRGGDDPTTDGDVKKNPGPHIVSRGRGGRGNLSSAGDVHVNPGPAGDRAEEDGSVGNSEGAPARARAEGRDANGDTLSWMFTTLMALSKRFTPAQAGQARTAPLNTALNVESARKCCASMRPSDVRSIVVAGRGVAIPQSTGRRGDGYYASAEAQEAWIDAVGASSNAGVLLLVDQAARDVRQPPFIPPPLQRDSNAPVGSSLRCFDWSERLVLVKYGANSCIVHAPVGDHRGVEFGLPTCALWRCECTCGRENNHLRDCTGLAALMGRRTVDGGGSRGEEGEGEAQAAADQGQAGSDVLPTSMNELHLLAARVPVMRSIPTHAQTSVAVLYDEICREVNGSEGSESRYLMAFWRFQAFATLILHHFPAERGGASARARDIVQRVENFRAGRFAQLIESARRAAEAAEARHRPEGANSERRDEFFVLLDDDDSPIICTDADAHNVPESAIRRASGLAKYGHHGMAARAVEAARLAPQNSETLEKLLGLHPRAPADEVLPGRDMEEAMNVAMRTADPKWKTLKKALAAFNRGTSAGPSRLSIQHLVQITRARGHRLKDSLPPVIGRIMKGQVPAEVRDWLYGARLIALEKNGGGIRPIACGDIMRRIAGKMLSWLAKKTADTLLLAHQVGVGVRAGGEGMLHAAQRLSRWLSGRRGAMIMKLDWRNAFNSILRSAVMKGVARYCPFLAGYVRAAYGSATNLLFGEHIITSVRGVQQGDPLGPLLFSLGLLVVWHDGLARGSKKHDLDAAVKGSGERLPGFPENISGEDLPELDFAAWFLDDGTLGGRTADVLQYVERLKLVAQCIGLELNEAKCEIICNDQDVSEETAQAFGPKRPFEGWELLGASMGDDEHMAEHLHKRCRQAARKVRLIARMAAFHKASALVTLRLCGAFPLIGYFLRAEGRHCEDLKDLDRETRRALESIIGAVSDDGWFQAQLPVRSGGLGLRSADRYAAAARLASIADTVSLSRHFIRPGLLSELPVDEAVGRSVNALRVHAHQASLRVVLDAVQLRTGLPIDPEVFANAVVDGESEPMQPDLDKDKVQRLLSTVIDAGLLNEFVPNFACERRARFMSITSPGASLWLTARDTVAHDWLPDDHLQIAIRMRLGEAVYNTVENTICVKCGRRLCDRFGHHSLLCRHGSDRIRLHNNMVKQKMKMKQVFTLASMSHLHPAREHHPWGNGYRIDIAIQRDDKQHLIDFAAIHVQGRQGEDATSFVVAASAKHGGAADRYERVKHRRYDSSVRAGQLLVPLVVDTFGAWGEAALKELDELARAYATQYQAMGYGAAMARFMRALNTALINNVAACVLVNCRENYDQLAAPIVTSRATVTSTQGGESAATGASQPSVDGAIANESDNDTPPLSRRAEIIARLPERETGITRFGVVRHLPHFSTVVSLREIVMQPIPADAFWSSDDEGRPVQQPPSQQQQQRGRRDRRRGVTFREGDGHTPIPPLRVGYVRGNGRGRAGAGGAATGTGEEDDLAAALDQLYNNAAIPQGQPPQEHAQPANPRDDSSHAPPPNQQHQQQQQQQQPLPQPSPPAASRSSARLVPRRGAEASSDAAAGVVVAVSRGDAVHDDDDDDEAELDLLLTPDGGNPLPVGAATAMVAQGGAVAAAVPTTAPGAPSPQLQNTPARRQLLFDDDDDDVNNSGVVANSAADAADASASSNSQQQQQQQQQNADNNNVGDAVVNNNSSNVPRSSQNNSSSANAENHGGGSTGPSSSSTTRRRDVDLSSAAAGGSSTSHDQQQRRSSSRSSGREGRNATASASARSTPERLKPAEEPARG